MSEHVKDSLFSIISYFFTINAPVKLPLPSGETTQAEIVPSGRQWPVESHRIRQMDTHQ